MRHSSLPALILSGAAALLAACGNLDRRPFGLFEAPAEPTEFDRLIENPGVYAGRPVLLVGQISVSNGQACLADRNRRIAVRLTADQATLWANAQNWPAAVEGVFTQNVCPIGFVCPEFCTSHGIEAGAKILNLAEAP